LILELLEFVGAVGEGNIKCYKRLQIIGSLSLLRSQQGALIISAMEPRLFGWKEKDVKTY
jgi:hypothetical protein